MVSETIIVSPPTSGRAMEKQLCKSSQKKTPRSSRVAVFLMTLYTYCHLDRYAFDAAQTGEIVARVVRDGGS